MGGSESNEFVARTDAGEDFIATCSNCGYAANLEKATSRLPKIEDENEQSELEEFLTPGVRTIEHLTKPPFLVPQDHQIKTLAYVIDSKPILILMRGDHPLQEVKLTEQLVGTMIQPFRPKQYHNEFQERLKKLIEAKQHGEKVEIGEQPKRAPVIDMMTALKKSLAASSSNTKAPKSSRTRKTQLTRKAS